jgi:hypothetical protein
MGRTTLGLLESGGDDVPDGFAEDESALAACYAAWLERALRFTGSP